MTHDEANMKEKITSALRTILAQRREAIRERLLSCLADHVEQELNDFSEPPALDDALFTLPQQSTDSLPAPSSPRDLSELLQATQRLNQCSDQVSILECLIHGAARFSARSVVFVCRNGQAMGWEQSGFAANPHSMAIRGAVLPLSEDSVLARVVSSGEALSSDEASLADPVWKCIGIEPSARFTAVPLTVRGRIAAILFADAGSDEDQKPLQADGLCILARMAELSLETMTLRTAQGEAQRSAPAQEQRATVPERATVQSPRASLAPVETTAVSPAPNVMSAPPEMAHPEAHQASAPEPPALAAEPSEPAPPAEDCTAAVEEVADTQSGTEAEAMAEESHDDSPESTTESAVEQASDHQGTAEATSTPSEPEVSTPQSDEEQLHEQARRFARLLISEILLYNPDQVQEGKQQHDLADRLKEDLGRSEEMYRQRVAPHVIAETNYFHEEVVRTLADGDPAVLGS